MSFFGLIIDFSNLQTHLCENCSEDDLSKVTLHKLIRKEGIEEDWKCLNCGTIKKLFCFTFYLPEPEEDDPYIVGLDHIKYEVKK